MKNRTLVLLLIITGITFLFNSCSSSKKTIINEKVVYIKKEINTKPKIISSIDEYTISENHFPSIGQNERIRFLIVHYTALDDSLSIKVLTQKEVSSHYLIPEEQNNKIELLVSEDKRAWHAGVSKWGKFENLNDTSIGIEIVNKGYKLVNGQEEYFNYTDLQIKKIASLAKDIIERYKIEPNHVLGHSDVSPTRKSDPGPKFPWEKLYKEHNIGAWYDSSDKEFFENKLSKNLSLDSNTILDIKKNFQKYGYDVEINGNYDKDFTTLVTKFRHHFRPEKYDGKIDIETYAILLALIKKYKS